MKKLKPKVKNQDLIVACATASGKAAIGIIRLSGKGISKISTKLFKQKILANKVNHCQIVDSEKNVIDEVIVLYFTNPHSYTGEDLIEIQAHGGIAVLQVIINRCLELGARIANPGEFTTRAFSNAKIDLAQAEAIADLINATNEKTAKLAVASMRGVLSKTINTFAHKLFKVRSDLEAFIDFSDDVDFDEKFEQKIKRKLNSLATELNNILAEFNQAVTMREGSKVALIGKPNAGKSSLLNCLCKQDLAIIDDAPGTTRDVISTTRTIDGMTLTLFDTAGLRKGGSKVEKEGIKRTQQTMQDADLIIHIQDINDQDKLSINADIEVINKIDLQKMSAKVIKDQVYISAKYNQGITALEKKIKEKLLHDNIEPNFLARTRHINAIEDANKELNNASKYSIADAEIIAEHLKLAHNSLGKITGRVDVEEILGELFSNFCIGK